VERRERENIAVRPAAARWARAAIADARKVIQAGGAQRSHVRESLRQLALRAWDIVKHPVGECAPRSVGVLEEQHEALRLRRPIPAERRSLILAIAGVLCRD